MSTAFISKPGARTISPSDERHRALGAERDDDDLDLGAEPLGGRLRRVLAGDHQRLAAVDEQRAGVVEVARRVAGERARVVVAAGRVAAHPGRHDVELVERDDDRARRERGDLRGARADARLVGDHGALAAPRHDHGGRRPHPGVGRELDPLALERRADEAAVEVVAQRHGERRAEAEPGERRSR